MAMTYDFDKYFEVILELTKEAGKLISDRVWSPKAFQLKSCDVDLVTETDQQVEKLLISNLTAQFPDHKFIGEEATADGIKAELTNAPTWIIDPVDGTMNFVHGYPNVAISVALWVDQAPELAIVYNPILEHMFTARKGKGAFFNGKQIHVSGQKELAQSLLVIEFGTTRDAEKMKNVMENLTIITPLVHGTRSSGSAACNMAMVALGAADANFEFGIHAWDIAAGCLLVREAGGVVIDPAGGEFDVMSRRVLCASSPELAQQISAVLIQHYPERD